MKKNKVAASKWNVEKTPCLMVFGRTICFDTDLISLFDEK